MKLYDSNNPDDIPESALHWQQYVKDRVDITDSGCWEHRTCLRYPTFSRQRISLAKISLAAFTGIVGEETLFACHTCDNPRCLNPDHIFLGTHQDNVDDKVKKGRGGGPELGESHHGSILTEEAVRTIRSELERGICQDALARRYKVTQAAISKIKRGLTWRHIT
jgi:hypothetical protein